MKIWQVRRIVERVVYIEADDRQDARELVTELEDEDFTEGPDEVNEIEECDEECFTPEELARVIRKENA